MKTGYHVSSSAVEGSRTGACYLEQIVLLELLEYAAFDFNKLIGHEER